MMTEVAAARIDAASSGVALRTVRSPAGAAAPAWTEPNAPKSTFVNDRFIALHMMTERMNPEAPSRAPAMMRSLLSRTKPMAEAERPAYEVRSEMTVGMTAPP